MNTLPPYKMTPYFQNMNGMLRLYYDREKRSHGQGGKNLKQSKSDKEGKHKENHETDYISLGIAYGTSIGLMIGTFLSIYFGIMWIIYGNIVGMLLGMAIGYYKTWTSR